MSIHHTGLHIDHGANAFYGQGIYLVARDVFDRPGLVLFLSQPGYLNGDHFTFDDRLFHFNINRRRSVYRHNELTHLNGFIAYHIYLKSIFARRNIDHGEPARIVRGRSIGGVDKINVCTGQGVGTALVGDNPRNLPRGLGHRERNV